MSQDGIPEEKRYTIGQAAKALGVSQRSLRYYEEAGLIEPKLAPGSGYRYYTAPQISAFREYRDLRGFGFSLDEAGDYLFNADFPRRCAMLEAREAELRRQIAWNRALLELAAEWRRRYAEAESELGVLTLLDCPAMVRFDFEKAYRYFGVDENSPLIKALLDKAPLVFNSVKVDAAAMEDEALRLVYSRGLGFWEKDAALVDVPADPPLERIPARRAVRLVSPSVKVCRSSWMDDLALFCRERDLEVSGDILGAFYAGTNHPIENRRSYYEFWAPVQKSSKDCAGD